MNLYSAYHLKKKPLSHTTNLLTYTEVAVIAKPDIQGSQYQLPKPHAVLTLPVVHDTGEYRDAFLWYLSWHQSVGVAKQHAPAQLLIQHIISGAARVRLEAKHFGMIFLLDHSTGQEPIRSEQNWFTTLKKT